MNIIFPSAGVGHRFSSVGYADPKPFIKIQNKYMIEYALSSLKIKGNYWIITSLLDPKYLNILDTIYNKYDLTATTINLNKKTNGAPATCLEIEPLIDPEEPLMIINNDHCTPWNHKKFENFIKNNNYDGIVTIYNRPEVIVGNPSIYSHIKVNSNKIATEFAEKTAISKHTLNGIFYWKHARLFFESAKKLIKCPLQVNGEKYISQTFNFLIEEGYKITYYKMGKKEYISIGTPEDVMVNSEKL